MSKKYYHVTSVDYIEFFYLTEEEVEKTPVYTGNWYGPFDTLEQCKKDALSYHQTTVNYAMECIREINSVKARDLKNEK